MWQTHGFCVIHGTSIKFMKCSLRMFVLGPSRTCITKWFVGEILSLKDFPDFLIYAACECECVWVRFVEKLRKKLNQINKLSTDFQVLLNIKQTSKSNKTNERTQKKNENGTSLRRRREYFSVWYWNVSQRIFSSSLFFSGETCVHTNKNQSC